MASPEMILEQLRQEGYQVLLDEEGENLIVRHNEQKLTPELRELLKQNKPALLDVLQLPNIPQIISKWEKPRRLDFAGAVGRSRRAGRKMTEAIQAAFIELRDMPSMN